MNKGWTDEFRRGMEYAANLYEQVDPASDRERVDGSPGAGAMGAVIEFRDLIRKEMKVEVDDKQISDTEAYCRQRTGMSVRQLIDWVGDACVIKSVALGKATAKGKAI